MLPRLMRASGLSGLSSRDLSVQQSPIKVAKIFVDAARFMWAVGLSGLSSRD